MAANDGVLRIYYVLQSTRPVNIHMSMNLLSLERIWNTGPLRYTRKNAQGVAILMKTGLNNVLLPTLFIAVNNIEQYCYTRFRLNNIVQYC